MKKRTFLTFFAISSAFFAAAQTSVWEVSKGRNKVYIAGSVHILRPGDYPLPKEFEAAYEKADMLVFEADLDKLASPEAARQFMKKMTYTDGKTLQSVLSEKTYIALEESLAPLPIKKLDSLKPIMAILTITAVNVSKLGITTDGVDKYFFDRAKKDKKKMQFLETPDYQVDLLSRIGDGREDDFVMYSLNDLKTMEKDLNALISTWRNGSATLITSQIKEMQREFPELYQSMLVKRNQKWLSKIEIYINNDRTELIIIGDAHLHGSDGLLHLLSEKGYKVKQIKAD
ncbi:GumN protein [Bacteroidia bacterium]|nr:GumN protein [Bacteroidia bacterium]